MQVGREGSNISEKVEEAHLQLYLKPVKQWSEEQPFRESSNPWLILRCRDHRKGLIQHLGGQEIKHGVNINQIIGRKEKNKHAWIEEKNALSLHSNQTKCWLSNYCRCLSLSSLVFLSWNVHRLSLWVSLFFPMARTYDSQRRKPHEVTRGQGINSREEVRELISLERRRQKRMVVIKSSPAILKCVSL